MEVSIYHKSGILVNFLAPFNSGLCEREIEWRCHILPKWNPRQLFGAFQFKSFVRGKLNGGVIYYQSGILVNFLAPFNSRALWEGNWMEVLYTTKVESSSTFWRLSIQGLCEREIEWRCYILPKWNPRQLFGAFQFKGFVRGKLNGGVIYYKSGILVNFLAPFNSRALWEGNWMEVSIYYQSGILVNFLAPYVLYTLERKSDKTDDFGWFLAQK